MANFLTTPMAIACYGMITHKYSTCVQAQPLLSRSLMSKLSPPKNLAGYLLNTIQLALGR
jgi:hypothetical protein